MIRTDSVAGVPAEVFAPGDFIREEIEARGWTQKELAGILGRPLQTVNQIINGKKEVTPATAIALGEAFGTSAELWLNLESAYRLANVERPSSDEIARRARLRSVAPVQELIDRGWIEERSSIGELEEQVCKFLDIESLTETPRLLIAARRSGVRDDFSPSQVAWACRAKHVASTMAVPTFDYEQFTDLLPNLSRFSSSEEKMRQLRPTLTNLGLRLVVVPHLRNTRIDGAMFWLAPDSPVVCLSLRYDRIDSFWFTLMHELAHVCQGHAEGLEYLDSQLTGKEAQPTNSKAPCERNADRLAGDWLVPADALKRFIRRTKPYYSRAAVCTFADELGIHPGIVVGRLQHLGEIPWQNLRRLLVKVSPMLGFG